VRIRTLHGTPLVNRSRDVRAKGSGLVHCCGQRCVAQTTCMIVAASLEVRPRTSDIAFPQEGRQRAPY
jgi:hypothetical protein